MATVLGTWRVMSMKHINVRTDLKPWLEHSECCVNPLLLMRVCECMCICVFLHVSICIFISVCVCLCSFLHMSVSLCPSLSVYVCVCLRTHEQYCTCIKLEVSPCSPVLCFYHLGSKGQTQVVKPGNYFTCEAILLNLLYNGTTIIFLCRR